MASKVTNKKQSKKFSPTQREFTGIHLDISTETQVALSKGIILVIIVIVMGILAYFKIFEPVVWSSLMTMAGYVAFANPKTSSDENS